MRFSSALLMVVLVPAASLAQEIAPGAIIRPKGELPMRDTPPGGLLGLKGNEVGVARQGTEYKVLEQRSITTVLGGQKWLKVQEVNDQRKQGWIFSGPQDASVSNVTPVPR
jgi:hypothetical protein